MYRLSSSVRQAVRLSGMKSIPILRIVIFTVRFLAVVTMAESLPVALIPEELLVATVCDNVIHIRRFDVLPFFQTIHTEDMLGKIFLSRFPPLTSVAASCRGLLFFCVKRLVSLTVFCAGWYQIRAAGVLAWCLLLVWHCFVLLVQIRERAPTAQCN